MKIYYAYLWCRANGTPYYVGKGTGQRAVRTGSPKNRDCIIIQEYESEADAFVAEKLLISLYGRKDNGTGILRNRTDGGDGTSGRRITEEQRVRYSKAKKGIPKSKEHILKMSLMRMGSKHSAETIRKMRDAKKNISEETRRKLSAAHLGSTMSFKGKPWSAARRAAQPQRRINYMATISKNSNYPAGVQLAGTTITARDTGNILGTVPPGKAGLKLVDGTQQSSTSAVAPASAKAAADTTAGILSATIPASGNVDGNFLNVNQTGTFNTPASGYSIAPNHE